MPALGFDLQFDHVIVGGGTAGCLLAKRLSEDRQRRVLLLEAGGSDRWLPQVQIPVGYLHCIGNPRTDWCWHTEPEPGLHGRRLRYPRGRVLGGCSSINGMIYMRGQARDYAHWAALTGSADWDWPQVLQDFVAHEDHHGGASPLHGAGGEWRVERQRLHWPLLDAVAEAAQQLGLRLRPDFNDGGLDGGEGVGYFEVNQRDGWRWNARKAFLSADVLARPNLQLLTGALAEQLLFDGQRCVGVQLLHRGQRLRALARRELLLAAGAIGTPALLQRSGLGPGPLLQRLGLTVRAELPGVGANLQDHLQLRAVYQVQGVDTLNSRAGHWRGRAGMLWDYLRHRRGPLSMAPSQLGLFMKSSPEQAHADLEFHVQPLSLPAFGEPLDAFPAFTASVCPLNPSSRGTVQITSPEADAAPRIAPNYLSTAQDRRVAAHALRAVRRLVAQPALQRFKPQELRPGAAVGDDEAALAEAAGHIGSTIFHPVGSCAMGRQPDAVLDARLRVRALGENGGLRVADASAFPTIPSGNTASPVLMLAEKAARWALQET